MVPRNSPPGSPVATDKENPTPNHTGLPCSVRGPFPRLASTPPSLRLSKNVRTSDPRPTAEHHARLTSEIEAIVTCYSTYPHSLLHGFRHFRHFHKLRGVLEATACMTDFCQYQSLQNHQWLTASRCPHPSKRRTLPMLISRHPGHTDTTAHAFEQAPSSCRHDVKIPPRLPNG
jgi:hypothetical protein